ncbi:MAG: hypothetical protein E7474_04860 [Ruminococcaceae bacterium]|nr:hypothetical protein [Oscillospiraceae bacterium]
MFVKRLSVVLSLLLVLCAVPVRASAGYADVADSDWFAAPVAFCTQRGLMNGTGGGMFSPGQPLTKAMVFTILWRLDGARAFPAPASFSDVAAGSWYASAVAWAEQKGLTEDCEGGRFAPDTVVNREQLAYYLWLNAGKPVSSAQTEAYKDEAEIADAAQDAVSWARSDALMNGVGDNRFSPKSELTRAQMAMVLMNLLEEESPSAAGKGLTEFDSALIAFLEDAGFEDESYMVSPTSFRAALALAVAGADGETKDQLIHAMGFRSMDEVNDWYASVMEDIDAFAERLRAEQDSFNAHPEYFGGSSAPDRAFSIANSVWHNADKRGTMNPAYIDYVAEHYDATAADVPADQLADRVNSWCNEKTNGLIPKIANDMSDMTAVLVNALYLRTSWASEFSKRATAPGTFTTRKGEKVQKDFMTQQDRFRYYEDSACKLLVMPMAGDISAVFVLGDATGIADKLSEASREEVLVKLPKFELETSFEASELVRFLISRGAVLPVSDVPGEPDFSIMSKDSEWYISDIIQKSKIKVDEDGIEAAAVTAVMMNETTAFFEPVQPKEFIADRPFSFYLLSGYAGAYELLFFGQLTE